MTRPSNLRPSTLWLAAATAAALAGCAVGPDYVRPQVDVGSSFAAEPGSQVEARADENRPSGRRSGVDAEWWRAYGCPKLDQLVQEALARNPTIEAARLALGAAQELQRAQQASFFPTVQAQYTPTRTKIAGNLGGNSPGIQGNGSVISTKEGTPASEGGTKPFNSPVIYNFHTAQVSVGYSPDVFGGNQRRLEVAQAQVTAQQHEWHAARVTLAANLVAAAILDASLREQIRLGEEGVESAKASLGLLSRQRRAGLIAASDEAAQTGALATMQQSLVPLRLQLQQNRNLMRTLVGATQDRMLPAFELAELHRPEHLPVTLPSDLLEQRPDVRQAEETLRAASAQVGVARAERLPQFDISANLGGAASHLTQMFWSSGRFFDITGNLVLPLFDAGAGKHRELAARAQLAQAQAQYRAVVLGALQNVADVLRAIESDESARRAAEFANDAAVRSLEVAERQLRVGYADAVAFRTSQVNAVQARMAMTLVRATELSNTAALFQALGGGWWNVAAQP